MLLAGCSPDEDDVDIWSIEKTMRSYAIHNTFISERDTIKEVLVTFYENSLKENPGWNEMIKIKLAPGDTSNIMYCSYGYAEFLLLDPAPGILRKKILPPDSLTIISIP